MDIYNPLTRKQYQKAIDSGFSHDSIIENEKIRKSKYVSLATEQQLVQDKKQGSIKYDASKEKPYQKIKTNLFGSLASATGVQDNNPEFEATNLKTYLPNLNVRGGAKVLDSVVDTGTNIGIGIGNSFGSSVAGGADLALRGIQAGTKALGGTGENVQGLRNKIKDTTNDIYGNALENRRSTIGGQFGNVVGDVAQVGKLAGTKLATGTGKLASQGLQKLGVSIPRASTMGTITADATGGAILGTLQNGSPDPSSVAMDFVLPTALNKAGGMLGSRATKIARKEMITPGTISAQADKIAEELLPMVNKKFKLGSEYDSEAGRKVVSQEKPIESIKRLLGTGDFKVDANGKIDTESIANIENKLLEKKRQANQVISNIAKNSPEIGQDEVYNYAFSEIPTGTDKLSKRQYQDATEKMIKEVYGNTYNKGIPQTINNLLDTNSKIDDLLKYDQLGNRVNNFSKQEDDVLLAIQKGNKNLIKDTLSKIDKASEYDIQDIYKELEKINFDTTILKKGLTGKLDNKISRGIRVLSTAGGLLTGGPLAAAGANATAGPIADTFIMGARNARLKKGASKSLSKLDELVAKYNPID